MSSETSTRQVRLKPDVTTDVRGVRPQADHGLAPWQFFVLSALGCATAGTFLARGQGVAAVILISVLMAAAALVGLAALRTFRPLVSPEDDRVAMVGQRTRLALEREKLLTLKTIKELEFDRAMGKLSDADWQEMSTRLRARAARLMRQLDAASGFRDQIERDLAKRLGDGSARLKASRSEDSFAEGSAEASAERGHVSSERSAKALAERLCAACSTANDDDARFCKTCGQPLAAH
jgi:hypothetical protein